jgi:phosphatidyl-myo-inositol alpha-mannosyltransferase
VEPSAPTSFDDGLKREVGADSPATPTLRIVTVCPYSLSRPGGVQSQAVGLTRALAARGHRTTLYAPLDHPNDAPPGIDFVSSGHSLPVRSNGSVAPVALSPAAAVRSTRAIRASRPDVVHVHEPFAPGVPLALFAGHNRFPVVATFHRSGASAWYSLLRPVTSRLAARLAVRCAVSDAARTTASEALGGEYRVLFNGVEVVRLHSSVPWPTDRPALLFLGRHEERKGLAVLLAAFEGLLRRRGSSDPADHPRPVLWIAGDGPLTDSLRSRYPENDDRRWLGVLSDDEKTRRLAAAEVVCVPSLAGESFGMVLLEAMAAGTVVAASDIEGYRDAAGDKAVLVAPGDIDGWTDALDGVLSGRLAVSSNDPGVDGDGRGRWLASAASRAEGWSMARLAECYERVYLSAVAGTGG